MNRKDFYFRELVTEAEIDEAFDGAEVGDRNFAIDNDFIQKANGSNIPFSSPDTGDFNALLGGIVKGLNITIAGLGATVSNGTAYDCQGRRICLVDELDVDLSTTGDTAIGFGGAASGIGSISTAPASGQFRWILLQIFFNRLLTDPREDGNLATVYFDSAESFQFKVKASSSSATPTIPGGDANCVILGAFKRNDAGAIVEEDYSTRGDWIRTFSVYDTDPLPTDQTEDGTTTDANFIQGTPRSAILKLRNAINLSTVNYAGHISQSTPQDKHAAKNIDFEATSVDWADGTSPALATQAGGGLATNGVQVTINTLVSLLASVAPGAGGTKKIGGASISSSPVTLAAGTLRSQLDTLLTGLNDHINGSYQHPADEVTATTSSLRTQAHVQGQLEDLEDRRVPSIFGNGADGDIVISSDTVLTSDMNYNNLTVNSGITFFTNNFVIRVKAKLLILGSGKIQADDDLGGFTARHGDNAGIAGLGSITNDAGTLLGGSSGGAGANAGTPGAGTNLISALGGNGGAGGGVGFGIGGLANRGYNAGVGSINNCINQLQTNYLTPGFTYGITGNAAVAKTLVWVGISGGAGGGGGNGTGGFPGGGGGAGGGIVAIVANDFVVSADGAIYAPGYRGANGASSGSAGAGGGGGGVVLVWYYTKTGPTLTAAVCTPGGLAGPDFIGGTTAINGSTGSVYEFKVGI